MTETEIEQAVWEQAVNNTAKVWLITGNYGTMIAARLLRGRIVTGMDVPFRIPHHTCSAVGLVSELAIAAGGVLYLDQVVEFHSVALSAMLGAWRMMGPATRPTLIFGINWGPATTTQDMNFFERAIPRLNLPPIDIHIALPVA